MLQRVLAGLTGLFCLTTLVMVALAPALPLDRIWGFRGFAVLVAIVFGGVGYLVASRRPENRIGWLLLGLALLMGIDAFAAEYSLYDALRAPLPGAAIIGWLTGWLWTVYVGVIFGAVLALFPDGRPLTRRWWWLIRASVVLTAASALANGLLPVVISNTGLPNPLRLPVDPGLEQLIYVPVSLQLLVAVGSIVSLVLRYRRAGNMERHQLKWLAAAGAVFTLSLATQIWDTYAKWSQIFVILAMALIPIAIGVAILRYRLYEIDTIINRALVYGSLTALLGGGFVAAQNLIQRFVVETLGVSSDAVTIGLVFSVAAVFTPMRARLQAAVDRRFKAAPAAHAADAADPVAEALRRLARLRDEGLISDGELEEKKREILSRI